MIQKGIICNLQTGIEKLTYESALITSSTVEMFDPINAFDVAVLDEVQFVGDCSRGGSWTKVSKFFCFKKC